MAATRMEGYKLFQEGMRTLSVIEHNGVRIDVPYLKATSERIGAEMRGIETRMRADPTYDVWRKRFGEKSNIQSVTQLAQVLYKDLGYEVKALTATGRAKADDEALADIDLPFVQDYCRLKDLGKLRGTYLKGVLYHTVDGFLHPNFNLHTVQTYRSSCSEPNLQNVPVRNPEVMQAIRRAFIARKGRVLVEVDFSGVEVRVAACYTKDPNLIRYIKDPTTDMHRDTACDLFFLTPEQVDKKTHRDSAKNQWVFPEFYGSVFFQCAANIWKALTKRKFKVGDVTMLKWLRQHGVKELGDCDPKADARQGTFVGHCKEVERIMWEERFAGYTAWKKSWYAAYRRDGGFDTLTGFHIEGLLSRNQVLNYPIQGSAFHCLLWALNRVQAVVEKRKMKTLLVGQIHDSMLADVPENELQEYLDITHDVITRQLPKAWDWIIVPIEAESEVCSGGTWADKKQWTKQNGTWAEKP